MKVNDSGMPNEIYWNTLFDIEKVVTWLQLETIDAPIVEIGCGYGTFTIPVAQKSKSRVITFDIEPDMIDITKHHAQDVQIDNIQYCLRDVMESGTGLENETIGLVLLFNILHFEESRFLLEEATRILKPNGIVAIIHWRKDIETPRGPDVSVRPDEFTINHAISGLDLNMLDKPRIIEPYHWAIKLFKGFSE